MLQQPELGALPELFEAYVARHRLGTAEDARNIELKREHSWLVMANARAIADSLTLPDVPRRLCLAAGLLHDFGRFPQYLRYRTFHDGKSENHARLGVRHLRTEQACAVMPAAARRQVQAAVMLHNRRELPRGISPALRCLAEVVRDADKLDIIRVMAGHFSTADTSNPVVTLHVKEDPEQYSPDLLAVILSGKTGDYTAMQWTNDFKILLCGWVGQLHFARSRTLLSEQGHIQTLLGTLPDTAALRQLREMVLNLLTSPLPEPACAQALRQWRC
ncbi:HD domain-containing protein [Megalodesulfovibrio gigas]|uniref:Putative metal-dependent phosphohydrolase HD sub domain-containing protein n=1 Tax=Megalodesulfovibrio gigas (strain ATCC 19364 / DSM 1382 / NCIMB 9332 / VKM B-1759) TaxID=1121448 RepID=T2GCX1_MEGG1|nr:HD domain-containing protein [Megalodesulfovibrio gigas]AGW13757.1 putative metal-dependent phosphohydrolase HD sub domain-containing protein [Megalodesulfovibrio gigas DSM 1382 = ATCC 19364]